MKKITLVFAALLATVTMQAQTTFDLDWQNGVNGAAASFTIAVGDAIHWTWANGLPHSVTSKAGSTETFDSGILTGIGTEFTFTFNLVGENDYGCVVHPLTMFGTITTEAVMSVQDKFERNIQFYPNPVDDELTIASLYQFDRYEIYNISGRKLGEGIGEGTYTHLNTSYLPSGMYFVRVTAGDLQATIRIIKK
ncbi:MAG: T9SS type A sorting domain-containing protein [Bacteroidetes bacterium]|nr:T9SS type A sorting domain-containing protein [Bacteroidota bacterium]